jgi:hypothetical protein
MIKLCSFQKPLKKGGAMDPFEDTTDSAELARQFQEILDNPSSFGNRSREERVRITAEQMWQSPLMHCASLAPPIPPNLDQLLPGM